VRRRLLFNSLLVCAATVLGTAAAYPFLPDQFPTHWGLDGRPDGWSHRFLGAVAMPVIQIGVAALMFALPGLARRTPGIQNTRAVYDKTALSVVLFLGYVQAVILANAMRPMDAARWIVFGLFVLFVVLGQTIGKVGRNPWMGIRTPWTLSSDEAWERTHRFASGWMVGSGVLGAAVTAFGAPAIVWFLVLAAAVLVPLAYSVRFTSR
jgi:uncharacterized membrane protein